MDLTGPAALAGFFVHIPDGTGVGMGQRGGHSSRNMILLKDRKDERGHKNTHIYTSGSQGKSESKVREANCLKKYM